MVTVLTGSNSFLINQEYTSLIDKFILEFGHSVEKFDGAEISNTDQIQDAVRSISFLEPRKLVVVNSFGQSKDLLEKIEEIVEQTAETTEFLLVDSKLDKRTSAYKYLQKNSNFRVFNELAQHELEKWVIDIAKDQGAEIRTKDVRFLIDRAGNNQQLLKNEIEKLILSERSITRELVEELVEPTPQSKVFSLLEELFRGRAKEAWSLYLDQRAQGEEPQKIIGMITWQLQQLTYAVFAPEKTQAALIEAGVSSYSANKALSQAKNITPDNLVHYIQHLAVLDAESKTSADVESALAVYFSDVSARQKTS